MIYPRTIGCLGEPLKQLEVPADPSPQEKSDVIGRSLLALFIVVEGQLSAGPAVKAYQAAIRRNSEETAEAGGSEAMEGSPTFCQGCRS